MFPSIILDDSTGYSNFFSTFQPNSVMTSNIILTGFMGCGKTTVGKRLAKELGYSFVDTDLLIEKRCEMNIPKIFTTLGEAYFRQQESLVAEELSKGSKQVISTGGRLMLDTTNAKLLGESGHVFCLVASAEEILRRISNTTEPKRPLLDTPKPLERIVELINEREKGYKQFQQLDTTDKTVEVIVIAIKKLFTQAT